MSDCCVAVPLTEEQKDKLLEVRNQQLKDYAEKIVKLEAKIEDMNQEQINEMHEHHEAIVLAKKLVQNLEEQNAELRKKLEDEKWYKQYTHIVMPSRQNGKTHLAKVQFNELRNGKAMTELGKINEVLTDTIIEVTENETDAQKLCYLERISAKFYEKICKRINELLEEDI